MTPDTPQLPKLGQAQPLVLWPNKNLLTKSIEVPDELIGSEALTELCHNMVATMIMTGGVGISAIQIGVPWRVVALRVRPDGSRSPEDEAFVLVNPVLYEASEDEILLHEGCLSFPGVLVPVRRPDRVSVSAVSTSGEEFSGMVAGWTARVLLHEVDHLDGMVFTSRMGPVSARVAKNQAKKWAKKLKRADGPKKKKRRS